MDVSLVTQADVAALRRWLRGRLGSADAARPAPAWVAGVLPDSVADICDLVCGVLDASVSAGLVRAVQANAWRAATRLGSARARQVAVARDRAVTPRTVYNWVAQVDQVLAGRLADAAARRAAAPAAPLDVVELAVAAAELTSELIAEGADVEQIEAVQSFAADRFGGPRPRRGGARRWERARAYRTVPGRLDLISRRPVSLDRLASAAIPLPPADPRNLDPAEALRRLEHAWTRRDRLAIPPLANDALQALRLHPDRPDTELLHAIEIITNALRDAENLRAMTAARMWWQLAIKVGGARDYRAWKARGVMIHMMEIHRHLPAATQAQRRHIDAFGHIDFPAGDDRRWHEQDRFARLVSLELASPVPGGLQRAQHAVRQMRLIQDAGIANLATAHAAVHRRRIEVELARAVTATCHQRIGRNLDLDRLVAELELSLADAPEKRSLSLIDLLLKIDIARRDWTGLGRHIEWTERAAARPDAATNLVERINARLAQATRFTQVARYVATALPDAYRHPRLVPDPHIML